VEMLYEPIDPIVFLPRILREPLTGRPAKNLYVPFGYRDSYFSPATQRRMAVNYGVPRVGPALDPMMDTPLSFYFGFVPLAPPVVANLPAPDGTALTGGHVQFEEDPVSKDGHYIVFQRPEVTHQFTCFAYSALASGGGRIEAASVTDLNDPCD